jgi:tRNA nucleotidyltransferase/poly(A) polymerase
MANKLTEWLVKPLTEDINIPVNVGDTILTGRFKNKKTVVKSIGKDEHGMPTINGRKVVTFRIKTEPKENIQEGKISLRVPSDIKKIHKLFKKNKKQLYIVGGAVRDAILGKSPKDFDLATDAKPDEVLKIAKKGGMKTYEVGKQFGVVVVGGHEIATFRKDIGKGRRPKAVDFSDIQGDVNRRDLTINSLFYDIEKNEVVDLTGGLEDLKNKIVKTVGVPIQRFDEDPLRKLRALRFQAVIGGKMDKDTEIALMKNPSLKGVSRERIREEFIKGIEKGKNSTLFMKALDKFKFTEQMFPQLKLQKPYPNVKSYVLFLSTVLRKTDISKLPKVLNQLKYSNEEVRNISFLVYLNKFKPEKIYDFKKIQEKTTLSKGDIISYGKLVGKDFRKIATFELSIKAGGKEFVGLTGKGIGAKIKELEKKKFLGEEFGAPAGIIPSPSRKGVEKMKKKGNTSVPYGSGYKKLQKELDIHMENFVNLSMEIGENTTISEQKIKKVIGIYGGRFQPFGPHHKKTYEWLKSQVDEAYITTSDIKKPPRHPMNFKEKVRHMAKMGIPSNRIVKEKTPYVANNTLKKYDSETTAVVYIFGKKDAGRLKGGTKKGGGKTYYQDFKRNKNNLQGYSEHGYILTAPHQSIKVGGKEVSGTVMRQLLGSPDFEKNRETLFKKAFGYYDKGVFKMMNNKFKKLFELFDKFLIEGSSMGSIPIDDGPPTYYDGFEDYQRETKKWIDRIYKRDREQGLGWELVNYILRDSAIDPGLDYTTRLDKVPTVAYGRRGAGPYGERFPSEDPVKAYKKWIEKVVSGLDFEILKWMGLTPDEKNVTGVPVEAPALPGVQTQDQNTQRAVELDLTPAEEEMGDKIKQMKESFMKDVDLLIEGGAYGHMSHPFDDNNLTFSDLKMIVINGLGGKLDREDGVTEKLDGQNLMVSWIDGKLRAARNKGHLKNFGKTSPTTAGIASMFSGRGEIKKAFVGAMKDLEKSIGSLSDKQKEKIFDNGKKWMNLEVMYPATSNVVDYDVAEIVFHGTLEYDESGRPVGQPKDSARMLAGMIKQTNNHIQKMFKIGKPNFLKVPKVQDFGKKKSMYLGKIKKLQSQYALSDKDTLGMYHESYWREYIFNASKQFEVKLKPAQFAKLVKRWAYFDKGYKIANIKKDYKENPKFLEWILKTDKLDHNKMFKQNIKPFEILFFQVGTEILKNISGYMAVNPDKTIQKMRKEMISAMKDLQKPDNIEKLKKLKTQIEKLQKIGGLDAIVPSEGIVFKYKGKVYKFTGAFAPINQILGSIKFG